jgi:hypothetical protein
MGRDRRSRWLGGQVPVNAASRRRRWPEASVYRACSPGHNRSSSWVVACCGRLCWWPLTGRNGLVAGYARIFAAANSRAAIEARLLTRGASRVLAASVVGGVSLMGWLAFYLAFYRPRHPWHPRSIELSARSPQGTPQDCPQF